MGLFTRVFGRPWYKRSYFFALIRLGLIRNRLRRENLYDTSFREPSADPAGPARARTPDGSRTDADDSRMGAAGERFGRNVRLKHVHPDEENLLKPNPRTVSRELLTRDQFIPAESLNVLAAAWIQFQVHDWFSHGKNEEQNPIEVPLEDDDSWPEKPMTIRRTKRDPTRTAEDDARKLPPTYVNTETHWWDGSQIYGSNAATLAKVRSGVDGKLVIGDDGLLPLDENGADITGVSGNFWIGLTLLHSLFTREHNAICDMLREANPSWGEEYLFDHARLVNTALMAKIHTVEWTPGILATRELETGMNTNWWGLGRNSRSRKSGNDILHGIPGSPVDHHSAPFSITEEFAAVYRMHSLVPDDFSFRALTDDTLIEERSLLEVAGPRSREVLGNASVSDAFYSLGTSHPGAITLHNFPRGLQTLEKPSGRKIDLAAIDILRDRERGVPRYNEFRRLFHMEPVESFEELTENSEWAAQLKKVYGGDIEKVDLLVGTLAEPFPPGFGFGDTVFRVFILMASRRLKSDRFLSSDYRPEVYSQQGLDWVENNTMIDVLLRHYPDLAPALNGVGNAFAPWRKTG